MKNHREIYTRNKAINKARLEHVSFEVAFEHSISGGRPDIKGDIVPELWSMDAEGTGTIFPVTPRHIET